MIKIKKEKKGEKAGERKYGYHFGHKSLKGEYFVLTF